MDAQKKMQMLIAFKSTGNAIKRAIDDVKQLSVGFIALADWVNQATKYTDQYQLSQQLLNHTFAEGTKELNNYINHLAEMTGISKVSISQATSLFGQMATSLGMSTKMASDFAERLDDLSARISIMTGADFARSSTAILGAMKGEVRTLATLTGITVKSKAQQNLLDQLGINAKVGELNAVNQALLKYLVVARQIIDSDEQMAKYAESVAYQKKVLTNQVKNLSQAFGNLLYPILKAVLPVINGVMIALANLVNFFANLFGYKPTEEKAIQSRIDDIDSLGASIASTSEKARKGLRSFDKLNNITSPTPTSVNGAGGTGVNAQLLDAMYELDDKMLNIKMKATEIAESIMKWLGFIYDANTGLWKFSHVTLGTILGALAGTGGVLWVVSKIVGLIKSISGVGNVFKTLTGVGTATATLGEVSKSANGFSLPKMETVLKGIAELTLIVGALVSLVAIMGALYSDQNFKSLINGGIEGFVTLFSGLAKIIIPLTAFGAGIAVLGNTTGILQMASGLADLAIVMDGTALVVVSLGLLTSISWFDKLLSGGLNATVKLFEGLKEMLIPIGLVSGLLALLGLATPAVMASGLAGFAIVIDGTALVVASLGLLAEIPYFKNLVNGGIELMVTLFYGLGRILGAIIEGFSVELTNGLPAIGTNLSNFALTAKPFFEITKGFTSETALGVKYLAEALLALTATSVLEGAKKFFTFGFTKTNTFEEFGKQLALFAPYFKQYSDAIQGVNGDTVEASAKAALSLAELAKKLPNSGGWKDKITGNNDIDKWGRKLVTFGKMLKSYSVEVDGLKSDVIENSANSAKALSELSKNLPNSGGIKDFITGNNDIDIWGNKLVNFAKRLVEYSSVVTNLKSDVIQKSVDSAKALSELTNNLPNSGGVVSWFTGDNSIDKWGEKVYKFGLYFHDYAIVVTSVPIEKVNNVTNSIKDLVGISQQIKDRGLTNTLKDFAESLKSSSNNFNTFFSNNNGYSIGKDFGNGLASGISTALKNYKFPTVKLTGDNNSLLKSFNIKAYAGGGFVDSGEFFLARENGLAEMVGRIGSHTAVANNDQIIEGIAQGVARANEATKNTQKVEIVATGDASGLLDFITFKQKEQDRQYGF